MLTTGIAREFTKLAANSTLAEVPHAGHMVAGDNNDAFTAAIRAWLDTLAARTPPKPTTNGAREGVPETPTSYQAGWIDKPPQACTPPGMAFRPPRIILAHRTESASGLVISH